MAFGNLYHQLVEIETHGGIHKRKISFSAKQSSIKNGKHSVRKKLKISEFKLQNYFMQRKPSLQGLQHENITPTERSAQNCNLSLISPRLTPEFTTSTMTTG